MFDKLVLENRGAAFNVTFNGEDYLVPSGKFEAEATLGYFIVYTSNKWWMDVKRVSLPIPPRIESVIEPVIEVIEDETVVEEEVKAEEPVKEVEKPKTKKK